MKAKVFSHVIFFAEFAPPTNQNDGFSRQKLHSEYTTIAEIVINPIGDKIIFKSKSTYVIRIHRLPIF